jgi:quercetin dioxygenase-like cupin family protein
MLHTTHPHHDSPGPSPSSADAPTLLIRAADLPGSPDAHRFIGDEHGGLPLSLFLVNSPPGSGPLLHRHPYPELFIVHAGQARFEIDGVCQTATSGDILIAPAGTAHRFTNVGRGRLRITAIHTAPAMNTEWLDPAPSIARRSPRAASPAPSRRRATARGRRGGRDDFPGQGRSSGHGS